MYVCMYVRTCSHVSTYDYSLISPLLCPLYSYVYRIEFVGVLGYLPQPEISTFLDGNGRRTVHSQGQMFTDVWTNGEQGESIDFLGEHCAGVSVYVQSDNNGNWWISGMTGMEEVYAYSFIFPSIN